MLSSLALPLGASKTCLNILPRVSVGSAGSQRGMATLKDLKLRLKSIASIAKLTKTMQMVANSKLKSAQRKNEQIKPFAAPGKKVNAALNVPNPDKDKGKTLYIVVTSDRGMCGPVNNQLVRYMKAKLKNNAEPEASIAVFGGKGTAALRNAFPDKMVMSLKDLGKKQYSFLELSLVIEELLEEKEFDNVTVVFNHFKNALTYLVTEADVPGPKTMIEHGGHGLSKYDLKHKEKLKDLFEFQLTSTVWAALYDTKASELAARMTSMDNATKNANALIGSLQLLYNRTRQAVITKELIEITSGASALN